MVVKRFFMGGGGVLGDYRGMYGRNEIPMEGCRVIGRL